MILVTGQPRTGTTAVARILHHLGCPMGTMMHMPLAAPGCDYDFEDALAVSHLVRHAPFRDWWPAYESTRRSSFRQLCDAGIPCALEWGVKSPGFLPFVETLRDLAHEPVRVVLCVRNPTEQKRSFQRQIVSLVDAQVYGRALELYSECLGHEALAPDLVVEFDELRADDAIAHDLASLCGSKEDATRVYLDVARHWSLQ